ncbi:MAG: hypothetical protein IJS06_06500 [Prevotella sp.]|nr:hypothetical protein [Prevotella sp.]
MIVLSLDSINRQDVYYVMISPQGGYIFETEKGIHYTISFEEESSFGGCGTYQFIIEKRERTRSAHDPKVEQTILAILNQFFVEHLDVLLYLCDDSDGREVNRNRLFLTWFKKHAAPDRFAIRTASAIVEGKGFYAAIIVENRNPLLETIIADFETTAQALTAGKP